MQVRKEEVPHGEDEEDEQVEVEVEEDVVVVVVVGVSVNVSAPEPRRMSNAWLKSLVSHSTSQACISNPLPRISQAGNDRRIPNETTNSEDAKVVVEVIAEVETMKMFAIISRLRHKPVAAHQPK